MKRKQKQEVKSWLRESESFDRNEEKVPLSPKKPNQSADFAGHRDAIKKGLQDIRLESVSNVANTTTKGVADFAKNYTPKLNLMGSSDDEMSDFGEDGDYSETVSTEARPRRSNDRQNAYLGNDGSETEATRTTETASRRRTGNQKTKDKDVLDC